MLFVTVLPVGWTTSRKEAAATSVAATTPPRQPRRMAQPTMAAEGQIEGIVLAPPVMTQSWSTRRVARMAPQPRASSTAYAPRVRPGRTVWSPSSRPSTARSPTPSGRFATSSRRCHSEYAA